MIDGRRLSRWAWVSVALTPVLWVLSVAAEFAVGGGGEPGHAWYTQLPYWVLWLAPGATAFVLAFLARRWVGGAGKVVFVVAAALLTFSIWVLVGGSLNVYAGMAAVAATVAGILVAVYAWPGLTKPPSGGRTEMTGEGGLP